MHFLKTVFFIVLLIVTSTVLADGTFVLSKLDYTINENDSHVVIAIQRVDSTAGSSTVTLNTSDGTAIAGVDYEPRINMIVSFGDGDTTKWRNIPMIDNALPDGDKTFNVSLSNPTGGAVLGSPSTATVTIVDDEGGAIFPPGPGSIDSVVINTDPPISELEIISGGYPHAFIFWTQVAGVQNGSLPFADKEAYFNSLQGINVPADIVDAYVSYKQRNPSKLVLQFHQGRVFSNNISLYDFIDRSEFIDGHWLYHEGATITSFVSTTATSIPVNVPANFQIGQDAAMCTLSGGQPNWENCEQMRITGKSGNNIIVNRGLYGSSRITVPANSGWLAAHADFGWGDVSWAANFTNRCPTDSQGRTARDIFIDQILAQFNDGGSRYTYDGIEFDAYQTDMYGLLVGDNPPVDADGDGVGENAVFNGVNEYHIGLYDTFKELSDRIDSKHYFMADASSWVNSQIFVGAFGGIENEGWPDIFDESSDKWSSAINRLYFWRDMAGRGPKLTYINHKPTNIRDDFLALPYSDHRLVFAAGVFTDTALTFFHPPPAEAGQVRGIFDELYKGTERQPGWLGQPLGESVHIADTTPDTLNGIGQNIGAAFLAKITSADYSKSASGGNLVLSQTSGNARPTFTLNDVPVSSGGVVVKMMINASKSPEFLGRDIGRLMNARLVNGSEVVSTQVDDDWFEVRFYFRNANAVGGQIDILFTMIQPGNINIGDVSVHQSPDVVYREFENGLVVANPSDSAYTFNLGLLTPGRSYRRLNGASQQDPVTNNGAAQGNLLTLQGRDALFLVAQ